MTKKLLLALVCAISLNLSAQLNIAGDGFTLTNTNANSNCYKSTAPNNGGIMSHGSTIVSGPNYLTSTTLELVSVASIPSGGTVTWFAIPVVVGSGQSATCGTLYSTSQGINMSSTSKVSITAAASAAGAVLEFYLGGEGQWSPETSTYNTGAGSSIIASHTFAAANTPETFSIDYSSLNSSVWAGWAGKSKVQCVGYRSGTNGVTFKVNETKIGADAVTVVDPGTDPDPGTGSSCVGNTHTGADATFYNLIELGTSTVVKCSYDVLADVKGLMYGALDMDMLNETPAKYCGMCVQMTGPNGTAVVRVVDECPDCHENPGATDIDLSPAAFAAVVGQQSVGRAKMSWTEIPCPIVTPIHIIVQGSNEWFAKVIVGNHVNRIKLVEVKFGGSYVAMSRKVDNSWELGSINGTSKDFRITDIYDQQIEVKGVSFVNNPTNSKNPGTSNFSACTTTEIAQIDPLNYISAYPNPASEQITFDGIAGVQEIVVFNSIGEVVATQSLNGATEQISLNVANLNTGLYFVKMSNGSKTYSSRFVKL